MFPVVHNAAPPVSPVLIPSQVLFNKSRVNLKQQRLSRYFRSDDHPIPRSPPLPAQSMPAPHLPQSTFLWGDPHISGEMVDTTGVFRVYSQNVNGLSTAHCNLEAHTFAKIMSERSVAIAGIQETNRNFERPTVTRSFHDCLWNVCSHHQDLCRPHISTSSRTINPAVRQFLY